MTAAPRPASTVVLLRDTNAPEVFLVRRHDQVAFMGGAHVFPGGSVDRADHLDDAELICDGVADAAARLRDVPAGAAVALHVAAIRELFEEAGVLLARRNGALLSLAPDDAARMLAYRRQLASGSETMAEVARRESLRLAARRARLRRALGDARPEARRFDARFFLAAAPPDQDAAHDAGETTHGEWMTPADAIARCRRSEIALPPPTWTTLRALERFATVAEAMTWARSRAVPRVQPGMIQRGETRIVLLPGDRAYAPVAGFEAIERRFILEGGRWRPVEPD